jgi:hypothetical protein
MLELMRAGQIAPRAITKIALGGLDSYRGTSKAVDQLIAHKAELMTIVSSFSGDGSFKTKVDSDPKTLRLTVRAWGKTLSEVLPVGVVVPLAGLGLFMGRAGSSIEPAESNMVIPGPVPPIKSTPGKKPAGH